MSDVLKRLCDRRRQDVEILKQKMSLADLRDRVLELSGGANSLVEVVKAKDAEGARAFITEIKRASPSAGLIYKDVDIEKQSKAYIEGGAAAVSILTEPHEFLGLDNDLLTVRGVSQSTPLLRKDFTVDPYQIWEAKLIGADIVLLLANVLGGAIQSFLDVADEVGVEAIVETHNRQELDLVLDTSAKLIGINARNLKTFETRIEWVEELIGLVPDSAVAIAESGIKTLEDVERLEHAGAGAYLVGETLMRSSDPASLLENWGAGGQP